MSLIISHHSGKDCVFVCSTKGSWRCWQLEFTFHWWHPCWKWILSESRCSFWYSETVFVIWKSCRSGDIWNSTQRHIIILCLRFLPVLHLRSQLSKLTDSAAQWSKAFIILLQLPIQKTSPSPLVCVSLIVKPKMKCHQSCLSVVNTLPLLLFRL